MGPFGYRCVSGRSPETHCLANSLRSLIQIVDTDLFDHIHHLPGAGRQIFHLAQTLQELLPPVMFITKGVNFVFHASYYNFFVICKIILYELYTLIESSFYDLLENMVKNDHLNCPS